MNPTHYGAVYAIGLFIGMLVLLEAGRRTGVRRLERDPEGARLGVSAVEGSLFALLGLLIAFTFSGAAGRFDGRRQLVIEETNDIGTAYLRVDLLPAGAQPAMRELFREYLDTRIGAYEKAEDMAAAKAALARCSELQMRIWNDAVAACRESGSLPAYNLLLPALNQMFDITTTRTQNMYIHPPLIIFVMLGVIALACSFMPGYDMAGSHSRRLVHTVGFAAILSLTIYVIIDVEYPRLGLIRVDHMDAAMRDLRQSMNPKP